MAKTVLVSCNCESFFQDIKYGIRKRLANAKYLKNVEKGEAACTVCGKIHTYKVSNKAVKPKED